jgi:hypothetical protein
MLDGTAADGRINESVPVLQRAKAMAEIPIPPYVEIIGARGIIRVAGSMPLAKAIDIIDAAIRFARQQELPELLVNATALEGFDSPSVPDRFEFISRWAATAGGRVRVAMVARPEHIDKQRFGVTVGRNRGLTCDVFETEPAAIAWLDRGTGLQAAE